MISTSEATASSRRRRGISGVGLVLVAVYGILALAATGRSAVQILTDFEEAPFAYALSGLAAVVYILATVALVAPGAAWYRVAWVTIGFELLFVLSVGTLSVVDAALFPRDTVWSYYGVGYLFVPLVLPLLGMWWLARHPRRGVALPDEPARRSHES